MPTITISRILFVIAAALFLLAAFGVAPFGAVSLPLLAACFVALGLAWP